MAESEDMVHVVARVHNSVAFLGLLFLAAPFDAASECAVATLRGTSGV